MVGRIASKCLRHNLAPIVPNLGAHRRRLRGGALATPRHSLGCGETEASQGVAFRRWGGLVGVVRVGCEIYTADTVQQLRAIVERLERDEGFKK